MKFTSVISMATRDLAAAKGRSAISAGGIALGVAVLMIIAGLGLGARDVVLREIVRELPVDLVEVLPKTVDIGFFKLNTAGLLGEGSALDAAALERLRGLPGVAAAYPKLEVKLPLGAQGGAYLFKRRLYTDMFLVGLPPEVIAPEVPSGFRDHSDFVPVVISPQLIELYNSAVAPGLGMPQVNGEILRGFEFELVIGRSLMLGSRGASHSGVEVARIIGVSRHALRLGGTVPIETARRLLRTYGDASAAETYTSILLRAEAAAAVPAITQAVRGLGFSVDETAEHTGDILTAATLLASLVGLLVLALAGLNIAHSFFASLSERRRELAILRALGARRIDLITVVLAQAVLLGAIGGVTGVVVARIVAAGIDFAAGQVLPQFPFKPESFFSMPPILYVGVFTAAVVASVLGALWPALRAAYERVVQGLA